MGGIHLAGRFSNMHILKLCENNTKMQRRDGGMKAPFISVLSYNSNIVCEGNKHLGIYKSRDI